MNIQQLFQTQNGIPQWFSTFLWAIFLVALFFIRYWWKNWGSLWFKQKTESIYQKSKVHEELLFKIKDNEIDQDHWSMEQIVDKCYRKGYRNSEDRKDFMMIYHHYKGIDGNTDGEVLYHDFVNIPYKTELKVPESLGSYNPSEDAIKQMLEFYNAIKNKVISEEDIRPIKTKTEFVNKKKKVK